MLKRGGKFCNPRVRKLVFRKKLVYGVLKKAPNVRGRLQMRGKITIGAGKVACATFIGRLRATYLK